MNKYLNPKNYWKKIKINWNIIYYGYNLERIRIIERKKFEKVGFNYDEALKKHYEIRNKPGNPNLSGQKCMESIHSILFCGINHVSSINNILEIGTYMGESTLLLSIIFPNSNITTIDLPDNDPIFLKTYGRWNPEKREKVKVKQKQNIANPRIRFIPKNSFFLPNSVDNKFDLIWIDGGHSYPDIAWDICNAYHLCNLGGWIMCDDVYFPEGNIYGRTDPYEVLEYVKERTGNEITYFLKRESPEWSAVPKNRKYVALMRKS